jgi:hypothetical protein
MKKILLSLTIVLAFCFANASNPAGLFSIDEQRIATEMADINSVEQLVNSSNATLSQLQNEDNHLVSSALVSSYGAASIAASGEPPLGIPSFAWGFCFGILGILLVYVITEDRGETQKAFYGCIVWTVLYSVLYFSVFATSL